jgi:radical SAM/Cys-rich protein
VTKPAARSLASRQLPLADPLVQRALLDRVPLAREFDVELRRTEPRILQINVGKLCNQTCRHCHVDAGPDRREQMTRATMERCLALLERSAIPIVDITGGAPELHPDFCWLVERCRALGRHVIDRCNLTVLETPSHRELPEFLAKNAVELICSLPHYARLSTDRQRGDGVYERSIRALLRLNELGYGGGTLRLVLVTNPVGAFLPGDQAALEREWKAQLMANHGARFDALYCITNMPISRYLEWLVESGNLESYLGELVRNFNPAAAANVMCRDTLSVGWDGSLYDCDFNQMLELPAAFDLDLDPSALAGTRIAVGRHCFGCTAGAGSSCGGVTAR